MSNREKVLCIVCCVSMACSAQVGTKATRQISQPAETAQPAVPASQRPEGSAQPMRLVAITDASNFALQPRVIRDDEIVVPLPLERTHLANVEVSLLVMRRDSDEIMDQQTKIFDWRTRGAALHYYLPRLPSGDYVAVIRTMSSVKTTSGGAITDIQLTDQAQVAFHSEHRSQVVRTRKFRYHFTIHHAAQDTPTLIPDEADVFSEGRMKLKTILRNNEIVKVTLNY